MPPHPAPAPAVPPAAASRPPRWSVVVPVHDCAGYLAEALPGVLDELDRLGWGDDVEVLVVDDASSDDPAAVVERLGRGRTGYVRNEANLGAVATFNRCLALAQGDVVHLLHGDDLVLPGFYAAMDEALAAAPAALAAVCRAEDVTADGTPTHVTRSYRHGTGVWEDALASLAVSNRVRAPGVVVRRRAYEAVGGYRTDLPHAADWDMWTRLAAHGPVVFVDRVLARYRRHGASDTSTRVRSGANVRERVRAVGVVLAYVPPERRAVIGRRALAYAAAFAARTALQQARLRRWDAVAHQLREGARCLVLLPGGVRAEPAPGRNGPPG